MRRRHVLLGSIGFALTGRAISAAPAGPAAPVVLELFTSQGCSSCPPADALLGELTRDPGVIGLAWHVDYWNGLGWRDPFASAEWTQRQRAYAAHLRDEVYTPALVVNGAAMVVGSDRRAIESAMKSTARPAVAAALSRTRDGVTATFNPGPGSTAVVVLYDQTRKTAIGGGENSGRQLVEYRIVRRVVPVTGPRAELPAIAADQGAVLLVQDAEWRVTGAAELPPERPA